MNTKFDELTKSMAQSVTRRAALKKFGAARSFIGLVRFPLIIGTLITMAFTPEVFAQGGVPLWTNISLVRERIRVGCGSG
jgi:hypothetical protein